MKGAKTVDEVYPNGKPSPLEKVGAKRSDEVQPNGDFTRVLPWDEVFSQALRKTFSASLLKLCYDWVFDIFTDGMI